MTDRLAVVVDDNRLNREMVSKILMNNGFSTLQAPDASTGWRLVDKFLPALIVLDIMLPGQMDGVQLCRLIRSDPRFQAVPIVMITAAETRREADRSLAAGADILIPKPFSPKDFWLQVETLLKDKKEPLKTIKIFILDDDENDIKLAETVLAKAGFYVMAQSDAAGALVNIKNIRPDLLLLDVQMPSLSGDDLARIIAGDKTITHRPKIIFYSNKSANELRELAKETGAEGWVCKVDGPLALVRMVKNVLSGSA